MKTIRWFLLTVLLAGGVNVYASEKDNDARRDDSEHLYKGVDTTYIHIPRNFLVLRTYTQFASNTILSKGVIGEQDYEASLSNPFVLKQGFSVTLGFITLSANFNILDKPKNSFSFGLNSYGKKFAYEISFRTDKNFSGSQTWGGATTDFAPKSLNHMALTSDFYYIFNGNKFSYPAVFSQTRVQRKSAGSVIAALSANLIGTRTIEEVNGVRPLSFGGFTLGIGMGYGFNLVAGRWTFHASAIPAVVLVDVNSITLNGEKTKLSQQLIHFIGTGNLAILFNHNHFFAGLRGTFHGCSAGSAKIVQTHYLRANAQLCLGWRF